MITTLIPTPASPAMTAALLQDAKANGRHRFGFVFACAVVADAGSGSPPGPPM